MTPEEKLESAIEIYVHSWHSSLIKSEQTQFNKDALRSAFKYVAQLAKETSES